MGESGISASLRRAAGVAKEYWFLITIAISALCSVFYMLVFQVTPFDKYHEIRQRREQVRFHNSIGRSFLERGYHARGELEFGQALQLAPTNHEATNGRYLAQLFTAFTLPDWDPAIGSVVRDELEQWVAGDQLRHVLEKYLADLNYNIGDFSKAQEHFEEAIALKPDYADALQSYGWFSYSGLQDLDNMERSFRTLTEVDSLDYRGFHGLGYGLYMRALGEVDRGKRDSLVLQAVFQIERARMLHVNRLNVVMDFGEVVRSVDPRFSIYYHDYGARLLEDSSLGQTPGTSEYYRVLLLTRSDDPNTIELDNYVTVESDSQKRAWVKYQLALDYLALRRLVGSGDGFSRVHDRLLEEALELDTAGNVVHIYMDQLEVLNLLLPDEER